MRSALSQLSGRTILSLVFTALITMAAAVTAADNQVGQTGNGLCVMTYNLRYASATPPNAWSQRRPLVAECIRQVNPDQAFGGVALA